MSKCMHRLSCGAGSMGLLCCVRGMQLTLTHTGGLVDD